MKRICFIIFLITTNLAIGQIKNGDFEMWDTVHTTIYSTVLSTTYGVPNPTAGIINNWSYYYLNDSSGNGICRTTDSHSGNYCLILHNKYYYNPQRISYRDTLNYRPQYLQGFFKYIKGGTHPFAQGEAQIILTRFNGTLNDTIATSTYLFNTSSSFIPFQATLNYISALVPDSIIINIINSNKDSYWSPTAQVSNLLYLDDLTLSSSPLGIENLNLHDGFISVYPNPFSTQTTLQTDKIFMDATLTVYNSFGQSVKQIKNISEQTITLNRDNLPSGVYFIRLTQDSKIIAVDKFVITE